MKKNYTSPAIETTEILVEQGIAQSTVPLVWGSEGNYDPFGLGDDTNYVEETFNW